MSDFADHTRRVDPSTKVTNQAGQRSGIQGHNCVGDRSSRDGFSNTSTRKSKRARCTQRTMNRACRVEVRTRQGLQLCKS